MPSKSKSDNNPSGSSRKALPFEPAKTRKAQEKAEKVNSAAKPISTAKSAKQNSSARLEATAIPEAVSRRMVRRMALFCGIPSFFGVATFFVSYWLVTQQHLQLPHSAVVLVSMGFFGLGVVGLSYGLLSASWDEEAGGALGWSEFTTNVGRMTQAWRSSSKSSD